MIAILLASAGVAAGRLDVAVREWTNPHIRPCRRNRQRFDAAQRLDIADELAMDVAIVKTMLGFMAGGPGGGVAGVAEACRFCRSDRIIEDCRCGHFL